jgi:hypothetical protein
MFEIGEHALRQVTGGGQHLEVINGDYANPVYGYVDDVAPKVKSAVHAVGNAARKLPPAPVRPGLAGVFQRILRAL